MAKISDKRGEIAAERCEQIDDANPGPKYPHVKVQLSGEDGNAFAVLGATRRAMKRAGLSTEQVEEYQKEATAGDYDHLLQTTMRYVDVS